MASLSLGNCNGEAVTSVGQCAGTASFQLDGFNTACKAYNNLLFISVPINCHTCTTFVLNKITADNATP
jgi:hypothetical protein